MTREKRTAQHFLIVVRHSYQVPLDDSVLVVDARRVQIAKYEAPAVHVLYSGGQHSENRDKLLEVKTGFAEQFPGEPVIRRLSDRHKQSLVFIGRLECDRTE